MSKAQQCQRRDYSLGLCPGSIMIRTLPAEVMIQNCNSCHMRSFVTYGIVEYARCRFRQSDIGIGLGFRGQFRQSRPGLR